MYLLGEQHWDFGYDYELVHSWMLGREISNSYYAKFPQKFARWSYAKRVAFYPCIFDSRVPAHVSIGTCVGQSSCTTRHSTPRDMNNGTNYSAAIVHFVEYVDGACSSVGGAPSACVYPPKTAEVEAALKSDDDDEAAIELFVVGGSPAGGTLLPMHFRTLIEARDTIRALPRSAKARGVIVNVAAGNHHAGSR